MRLLVAVYWLFAMGCWRNDTAAAAPMPPPSPEPAATATCITKGGCGLSRPLPACPPGLATPQLAELVAHGRRWLGKDVAVRGPLRHTKPSCTANICALGTCCNRCSASLVLSEHDDVPWFEGAVDAILLGSAGEPDLFTCKGDDSTVCCAVRASGNEVVARGVLHPAGSREQSHTWSLRDTTLCVP
jgi:hypothetical protein